MAEKLAEEKAQSVPNKRGAWRKARGAHSNQSAHKNGSIIPKNCHKKSPNCKQTSALIRKLTEKKKSAQGTEQCTGWRKGKKNLPIGSKKTPSFRVTPR